VRIVNIKMSITGSYSYVRSLQDELTDSNLVNLLTFNEVFILVIVIVIFTAIGYKLHKLFHSCKNPLSSIRARYKYWTRRLLKIKEEFDTLHSKMKYANIVLLILIIFFISSIFVILYFKQLKKNSKIIEQTLLGLVIVIVFTFIYRQYVAYRIKKLSKKEAKYEKKKKSNVDTIYQELTPEMKVKFRENIAMEYQTEVNKQEIKLKRLEKEVKMYTDEVNDKKKLIRQLDGFIWCDYCNGRLRDKESMLFKCPDKCLIEYFTKVEELNEELQSIEKEEKDEPEDQENE